MAAFLAWRAVESSQEFDRALLRDHAAEATIAVLTSMLAVLAFAVSWAVLLRDMSPNIRTGRVRLLSIFSVTWLGRYVPGTLPFLAARVYVASRAGYGTRTPALATGFSSGLELLGATTFGVVALVSARYGFASPLTWACVACVLSLTAIAVHPRVLAALSSAARRVLRRAPLPGGDQAPSRGAMVTSVAFVIAGQALMVAGVAATAFAFTDLAAVDVLTIAAAVSLSGVAGVLVVLAPAGLGVRDGALAAMLAAIMPIEAAASVAVAYRALNIASDVLLAGIAIVVDRSVAWRLQPVIRAETSPAEQQI
jgi:uncharacterized membrane protein YbhN (UPF0104 family)